MGETKLALTASGLIGIRDTHWKAFHRRGPTGGEAPGIIGDVALVEPPIPVAAVAGAAIAGALSR